MITVDCENEGSDELDSTRDGHLSNHQLAAIHYRRLEAQRSALRHHHHQIDDQSSLSNSFDPDQELVEATVHRADETLAAISPRIEQSREDHWVQLQILIGDL
jgi:hypothetical protein